MRAITSLLIAIGFVSLLGPAAPAQAGASSCRTLSKQIARYQRDLGWAEERGNELWAEANRRQILRLARRRAERCPELAAADAGTARRLASLLGRAARTAARYFTFGP